VSNEAPKPGEGGPGATLLAERRRQNLSLGDVSRQLKLSVRQVEALERDDFAGFQGPVFIHGFLRNYAKLLGLDPQPLIRAADDLLKPEPAAVEAEKQPSVPAPMAGRVEKSRWPVFAGLAAVVVVAGLLVLNARGPAPQKPGPAAEPAPQVATAQGAVEKRQAGASKRAAEKPVDEKRAADRHPEQKPTPEKTADTPAEPTVEAAPNALGQAVATESAADPDAPRMVVRMIFDQDSWVEIKDRNGNTVFGQLNAAGTSRRASGEPPLTIVVGNAAGVRLFQGDKSIDLGPHTRVDVARLTLE
jgi:cytoskeleton protein RodZ